MEIGILVHTLDNTLVLEGCIDQCQHRVFRFQDMQELSASLNQRQVQVVIAHDRAISLEQVHQWRIRIPEIYWIMVTYLPSFTWAEQVMLAGAIGFSALPMNSIHLDTMLCHVSMQRGYHLQTMLDLEQNANSIDLSKPIESALDYIAHHLAKRLTLQHVSREVYLSPSHFSRLFLQKVGIHFNDYVLTQRIEAAKTLLTETQFPIELVATKIGFSSSSYFSQTFKRMTGKTPRAYRAHSTSQVAVEARVEA